MMMMREKEVESVHVARPRPRDEGANHANHCPRENISDDLVVFSVVNVALFDHGDVIGVGAALGDALALRKLTSTHVGDELDHEGVGLVLEKGKRRQQGLVHFLGNHTLQGTRGR